MPLAKSRIKRFLRKLKDHRSEGQTGKKREKKGGGVNGQFLICQEINSGVSQGSTLRLVFMILKIWDGVNKVVATFTDTMVI